MMLSPSPPGRPFLERRGTLTLIGMLALAVAYSTTVVPDFILLDGVTALDDAYRGKAGAAIWAMIIGRPVGAANLYFLYDLFNGIDAIKYIRMLGLVGLFCVFALFYRGLFVRFMGEVEAFCLALSVCLLAPFVVVAYWGTLTGVPVGAALAGVAMICIARSLRDPAAVDGNRLATLTAFRAAPFAAAVILMFLAACSYQPAVFIVTLLALLYVVTPGPRNDLTASVRAVAATLLALAAGSALYVISWKLGGYVFFRGHDLGNRTFMKSLDAVAAKLGWFFLEALPQAASVLALDTIGWLAVVVMTVCLAQFALMAVPWRERFLRALMWLALLPASYGANLLAAENHVTYRTLVGIQPFIWVSFCIAGLRIWGAAAEWYSLARRMDAHRGPIIVAATCALLAHQLLVRGPEITRPRIEELAVTRAAVARLLARDGVDRVVIVRAGRDLNLSTLARVTLIGRPSAAPEWAAASLFRVVYMESERTLPPYEIVQMPVEDFAAFEPLPGDHVINFDALLRERLEKLAVPLPHRD